MARPLVSVIVVARDEEENIRQCLSAVRDQEVDFETEIVVVDSGSTDRTGEVARSFGARVIDIPRTSFQHGRTRQMASERASGEYLVYLVADAVPADRRWLSSLVEAAGSGPKVAGAYSRQAPRKGAGPIEAFRLAHRRSSKEEREVRRIEKDQDFWAWTPEQRFDFCEFDDVSCCRRHDLLEKFPIPPVEWAEDLLWAREVLLAGYEIVFEPRSMVFHSHPDTLAHAFRRGYLDQAVVKRNFGVLYFDSVGAVLKGYPLVYRQQARAVLRSGLPAFTKARLLCWNLARLACEVAGNRLAAREEITGHTVCDLIRAMAPRGGGKGVLRTRFTLGADTRPVLFMNPDQAAARTLRIPPGARIEFGAAINPQARPHRIDPVLFAAAIDGEPVWSESMGPGRAGEEPRWVEVSVDLGAWTGKKVRLVLATRAENTDYGWAGWGSPRVVTDNLSAYDRAVNLVLERTGKVVRKEPLRHP